MRGMPVVARTSRTTVNTMIMAQNHRALAVQAVFESGQSILTPGGPSAISRAKWISRPTAAPASTARCRRLAAAVTTTTATVAREWVTGRCSRFPTPKKKRGM